MPQTKCMNPSVQLAGQYKRNTFWCNKHVLLRYRLRLATICVKQRLATCKKPIFFSKKEAVKKLHHRSRQLEFWQQAVRSVGHNIPFWCALSLSHKIFICIIFIIQRQLRCIIFNQTSVMVCFSFVTTYLFIFYILNSIFQDIILLNGRILQLGFLTPSPSH